MSRGPRDDKQADALIVRLDACGAGLRNLTLDLGCCPVLTSQTILPLLDNLTIAFSISSRPLQLSWLHRQPCRALHLLVLIHDLNPLEHEQALTKIQQLKVQEVIIRIICPFSAAMQDVWQRFPFSARVQLCILSEPESLLALPSSPWLEIDACSAVKPLHITWGVLASQPRGIIIRLSSSNRVIVAGHPAEIHVPFSGTDCPWMLCVMHGAGGGVAGLPSSQPCRRRLTYLLQNAAAQALGWPVFM